jgi:hypothetical protein
MRSGVISSHLNQAIQHCSGWEDFKQHFAGLPEKQKDDLFEELVKAYLLLDPEYATKLKRVWLHREVPSAFAGRDNDGDSKSLRSPRGRMMRLMDL